MAEPILYMGPSGCGKSSSLRNFDPKSTFIVQPNAKSLPFPGGDVNYTVGTNRFVTDELDDLFNLFKDVSDNAPHIKTIVLEDFTHFFSARIFSPEFMARTNGGEAFQRWNDFGGSVFQALFAKAQELRNDLFILVLHHTEFKEDGTLGFKSPGKLLDNTIDVPSYFTYVFQGLVQSSDAGPKYLVQTNRDAVRQAKTPYGIFGEMLVPNDMKVIIDRIRDYQTGKLDIKWT